MPASVECFAICSGWFEEFCIQAQDWMDEEPRASNRRHEMNNQDTANEFTMEPICNQHLEGGGYVYLTRAYWVALVKTFGFTQDGMTIHWDPDSVESIETTAFVNTRDPSEGTFSDVDIIDSVIDLLDIRID